MSAFTLGSAPTVDGAVIVNPSNGGLAVPGLTVSRNGRASLVRPTILHSWHKSTASFPTQLFSQASSTMTIASASPATNFIMLNSTQATTGSCSITSRFAFPVFGPSTVSLTMDVGLQNLRWHGSEITFGTTRAYFHGTCNGDLVCRVVGETTVTSVPITPVLDDSQTRTYEIRFQPTIITFWRDGIRLASIATPLTNPSAMDITGAQILLSVNVPSGTAQGGKVVRFSGYSIVRYDSIGAADRNLFATNANGAYQTSAVLAPAGTANWANSAAPATGGTYTTFGGQWRSPSVWPAASTTETSVFAYDLGAQGAPPMSMVTGIRIGESVVTTILAGGPLILPWFVAISYTGISASASFMPIGMQTFPVTAPVGTVSPGFDIDLSASPIPITENMTITIGNRIAGVTVTSGQIRGTVMLTGYNI